MRHAYPAQTASASLPGCWLIVDQGTADLRTSVTAGVYRAEVRLVPYHLEPWLGDFPEHDIPQRFIVETVWIYSNPIYVE